MKWREALGYLTDVVGDEGGSKKVMPAAVICRRKSFSQCLREQCYPGVYASMIITGFHSGKVMSHAEE